MQCITAQILQKNSCLQHFFIFNFFLCCSLARFFSVIALMQSIRKPQKFYTMGNIQSPFFFSLFHKRNNEIESKSLFSLCISTSLANSSSTTTTNKYIAAFDRFLFSQTRNRQSGKKTKKQLQKQSFCLFRRHRLSHQ